MTAARTVHAAALPPGSVIEARLPRAQFADCYETADPAPECSALQSWLDVVARTPGWTQALMALRNRLVRLVGLKGLGQLNTGTRRSAEGYRVGDRVGIFEIRHLSDREVVMGQDDKHLNVQVSLHKRVEGGQAVLALGTVVHIHNPLGHAYMAVVAPFHRRIVRAMLARVGAAGRQGQPRA